jgi:hypothetical protein
MCRINSRTREYKRDSGDGQLVYRPADKKPEGRRAFSALGVGIPRQTVYA